jgi:O-Antigen ligase
VAAAPRIGDAIHSVIRQGNTDAGTGSTRLLSASPEERFDYARVALHLFSGAPILGIGAGNFGRRYDALRTFVKHSEYTHNLPLRVLSETGVVGAALFVALLVVLTVGIWQAARFRDDLGRACAAIAMCVCGYFLIHSCLDWVDEFPALAAPALALPLAAIGLPGAQPSGRRVRRPRWGGLRGPSPQARRMLAAGLAGVGGVVLALALGTSYLSVRLVDRAFAIARTSPAQAYDDLSVARSLAPLSVNPITSEGTLALYLGDTARSERAFQRSVSREDDWYPRLELALIDAAAGRFAAAQRELAVVTRLDANDPLVQEARQLVAERRRIDPISFNRQVLQEGASTAAVQKPIK